MNFWYWHKHEFYAGFLTLLAIVAFFAVKGGLPTPPGGPPSLGVWNDKPTAPDKWATAGEETREASATAPQEKASIKSDSAVNSSSRPIPVTDAASISPGEAKGLALSNATLAQRPATANAVEAAPRPVEQMSEAEIQAAIREYKRWLHRGQITVVLDYTMLSGPQIDAIADAYVMESGGTRTEVVRLAITSNGLRTTMCDEALQEVLIGDLPSDRRRWPPSLQAKVSWFGPNAAVTAKMVLKDVVALEIYRVLAEQAGTVLPSPGTLCRVQLIPTNGQIDVRLVSFSQPKEPRI